MIKILGSSNDTLVRFILDSTSHPEIISLSQMFGQEINLRVMYLTRTWAFSVHKHKMKLLGRWPDSTATKRGRFNTSGINSHVSGTPAALPDVTSKECVTDHPTTILPHSHASTDVPTSSIITLLTMYSDHPVPVFSLNPDFTSQSACDDGERGGGGGGGTAVGGHGGASGVQNTVPQFVSFKSSPVTVDTDSVDQPFSQQVPLAGIECELTSPGRGGCGASGVLGGGLM